MIVSVTEMMNYNRCKRMWSFVSFNTRSLTRIVHSIPLETGTLWHKVQADWVMHPEIDPLVFHNVRANEMIESAKASYREVVGVDPFERELEKLYEASMMVRSMVTNYRDYYGKPLPDGYRIIQPEQALVVPIPHTEHKCSKCDGAGVYITAMVRASDTVTYEEKCAECEGSGHVNHYLEGTFDGIVADDNDQLFVLERKTYGARPKLETLNSQFQFLAYIWLLHELRNQMVDHTYKIGGVLYDGAWKREKPPRGSVMSDLFLRTTLIRPMDELEEFSQYLPMKVGQMYASLHDPLTPLDYNRVWQGCFDCNVQDLCTSMSRGEDVDYIINRSFKIRERTSAFVEATDD